MRICVAAACAALSIGAWNASATFFEKALDVLSTEDTSKPSPLKWSFNDPGMGLTVHFPNDWRADREKSGRVLLTRKNVGQDEMKILLSEKEMAFDVSMYDVVEAFKAKQSEGHPDIEFGEIEEKPIQSGKRVRKVLFLSMTCEEGRKVYKTYSAFIPSPDGARCIHAMYKALDTKYNDGLATAKSIVGSIEVH